MIRGSWLLAAVSCVGAVWSAAADDVRPRTSLWGGDTSSAKKASEYFSRGGRDAAKPAEKSDEVAKPSRTGSSAATTGSTRTSGSQFDSRLRLKSATTASPATKPAPRSKPSDEEIPFASSEPADKGGGSNSENPFETKPAARTPSGAPLSRSLSDTEAGSTVKDAAHTSQESFGVEPAVEQTAATGEENPFENLPPRGMRRPLPGRSPGLRSEVRPLLAKPAATPSTERATLAKPSVSFPSASTTSASTAGQGSAQVTVRWVKKSEINVGQECEFDLVVKNGSAAAAQEVTVDAQFPPSVRVTKTVPQPSESGDRLAWSFPVLEAGKEEIIRVSLIPTVRGELATTAHVRFTGSSANVFQVDEPMLAVTVKGPKEVLVGDPASHIITVSNPGTGTVGNVFVEVIVPSGLEHPRGERLSMEVGALGPAESRTVRLGLSAVAGGTHQVQVVAKADSNLKQVASSDVTVVAPSIKLALDGPSLRYVGRSAVYVLTIQNDGAAPSNNVRLIHKAPEGFQFVRADKGGKYDESAQTVSWFVGRLEPGQSVPVKVELLPTKLGAFTHRAGVVSEQGGRSEAVCETTVDGSAALQMEIVELADPVEVGAETVYEVRLKNNGSKAAQNVGISCELSPGVQLVSAKGPSEHLVENGLVVFKSLAALSEGQSVAYHVHVKGTIEGNHRFRVRLASNSITEPLISEELTKFYGE